MGVDCKGVHCRLFGSRREFEANTVDSRLLSGVRGIVADPGFE